MIYLVLFCLVAIMKILFSTQLVLFCLTLVVNSVFGVSPFDHKLKFSPWACHHDTTCFKFTRDKIIPNFVKRHKLPTKNCDQDGEWVLMNVVEAGKIESKIAGNKYRFVARLNYENCREAVCAIQTWHQPWRRAQYRKM